MKPMWAFFILLSLFNNIFFTQAFSQRISGEWIGNYSKTFMGMNPDQLIVQMNLYNDSLIRGTSHLYYKKNKFEHYTISGVFRKEDSTIYFNEDAVLSVNLGSLAEANDGNYKMKLWVTDSSLRFEGKWRDNDRSFLHLPTCQVWLEKLNTAKENTSIQPQSPAQDSLTESKKLGRKMDIQNTIALSGEETDSIKISIYDNGDVDGDTISLYSDNTPLIKNGPISEKPLELYISVNSNAPIPKLLLVAESTGTIPPCTAVMLVTTRKNKYQIHLSSTFETNAAVSFILKD